jgi:uncharacterized protein (DUF2249 family)
MDYKEFVKAFLTTALGMDETEVSALYDAEGNLKPDSIKSVLAKDASRIKEKQEANQEKVTQAHDKGYSKAKGEVLAQFEKDFKEKFKIDSDKKGLDLVDVVITKLSTDKNITDEDVKKHPLYLSKEAEIQKAKTETEQEWTKKYNDRETEIQQKERLTTVSKNAQVILEKLKVVLPEDPARKANHLKLFEQRLAEMPYDIKTGLNGETLIIPLKKGSTDRLEDQHGNPIPFNDVVKNIASEFWDFQQADKRSAGDPGNSGSGAGAAASTGASADANSKAKKFSFTKPKDDADFMAQYKKLEEDKTLSPQEKIRAKGELTAIWEEPVKA